jgi:hypothetical protein
MPNPSPSVDAVLAVNNSRKHRIQRLVILCSASMPASPKPEYEVQVDFGGPSSFQRNPGTTTKVVSISVRGESAGWNTRNNGIGTPFELDPPGFRRFLRPERQGRREGENRLFHFRNSPPGKVILPAAPSGLCNNSIIRWYKRFRISKRWAARVT